MSQHHPSMHYYDTPAEGLRAGMRRLAASVCVLSLRDAVGQRQAMTATAVTSVSDSPASLLVCVNSQATLCTALSDGLPFCINVLHAEHAHIAAHCAKAKAGEMRFTQGNWDDSDNLPFLLGAQAAFFCDVASHSQHGTHLIVIGAVKQVLVSHAELDPLLYADGCYHRLHRNTE